jgi:hypothetical protein
MGASKYIGNFKTLCKRKALLTVETLTIKYISYISCINKEKAYNTDQLSLWDVGLGRDSSVTSEKILSLEASSKNNNNNNKNTTK